MKALWALLLVALACPALAQDAVTVSALRDPVDKSYRRMVKGIEMFEALHALAPDASLRYRLVPRRPDTETPGVALSIVGDSFERSVPLAADRTFTLQRDARALEEDASVRPNRKAGTLTWRADIRTPGLAPNVRRLGDLRLECRVGMEAGLVSHYPSLFERFMDFMLGARAFCEQKEPPYLFFADRPLFAVTLVHGGRRETLSIGELYAGMAHDRAPTRLLSHCDCAALLDRAYFVPLGDPSWPDDTLVELETMDAGSPPTGYSSLAGSSKSEVQEIFGVGKPMRFGHHEVWAYDYGAAEVVVLFDPAGVVTKARLRSGP